MKVLNLIGERFGNLIVIKRLENNKYNRSQWLCLCDCGKQKIISGNSLQTNKTKSCGCLRFKHGHTKYKISSKTFSAWDSMKQRCENPLHKSYKNYGGRGITICSRWTEPDGRGFKNFLEDIGEIPKGYELDRINNNKLKNGYSPKNCRLSTRKEQARNRRSNHLIPYKGKEICIAEASEITGIHKATIRRRLAAGWTPEEALTIPGDTRYKLENQK